MILRRNFTHTELSEIYDTPTAAIGEAEPPSWWAIAACGAAMVAIWIAWAVATGRLA